MEAKGRGRRKLCRRPGKPSRAWYPRRFLSHGRPAAGAEGEGMAGRSAGHCRRGGLGRGGREAMRAAPGVSDPLRISAPCQGLRVDPALTGSPACSPGVGQGLCRGWEGICIWAAAGLRLGFPQHMPIPHEPCVGRASVLFPGAGISVHNTAAEASSVRPSHRGSSGRPHRALLHT